MPTDGRPPVELTRFIGREPELAALRALLADSRLLTLTGAGGSGKTRLALELAPSLHELGPDGVHWVDLAWLDDPDLIPAEVLRALGAPSEGRAATVGAIETVVRERRLVLILDNCEHLVDACAHLADGLLRACPQLRILATSREALGVPGERAWLVPPLRLPPPDAAPAQVAASDAVRLFVERARDAVADFQLDASNAAAVAEVCARLDGIPLAIELAAARVRLMTPAQIRDRLSDAFALLASGSRLAVPRHRTLRAAIDWSHDLLPEDGRVLLRRLSVFRGGFTLDAVEAVATGDGVPAEAALDRLAALADRSLVVVRERGGSARYHLLETMRQYAAQRLEAAGEAERVRGRFAGHVARLVEEVEPDFMTPRRRAAFERLEPELDNIREALHWSHAHDPALHVRLVGALWWFWYTSRHWTEARRWIDGALALPEAQTPGRPRAALLYASGALFALQAQPEAARAQLDESAALAAALGDDRLEAYALNYTGMAWGQQGRTEALEFSGRAERWFRAHGDAYGLRLALLILGMGTFSAGDQAGALRLTREAVEVARGFGQDRELAIALSNLAMLLLYTGDAAAAEPLLVECFHALRRDPSYLFLNRCIEYLGIVVADRDPAEAVRRIGAATAMRAHIGARRFPLDQERIAVLEPELRRRLGDDAFERAYGEGLALSTREAIEHVLAGIEAPGAGADAGAGAATETRASADGPAGTAEPAIPSQPAATTSPETATATAQTAGPAPQLRVLALGPLEVWREGERLDAWPYARPKELLVFLALSPRGRSRAEIGQAIWPGSTPAQLRNSFHVTVHHLRKTLGRADWIALDGERYRIAPEVGLELDADRFERELRRAASAELDATARIAALRSALGLYRGHLLAGEPFGAWAEDERDRLRRLQLAATIQLAGMLEESGAMDEATALYADVVAREPLLEQAHRRLLVAWTRAGERVRALRHYERLRAMLRDELELEPEQETVELFERIRTAQSV